MNEIVELKNSVEIRKDLERILPCLKREYMYSDLKIVDGYIHISPHIRCVRMKDVTIDQSKIRDHVYTIVTYSFDGTGQKFTGRILGESITIDENAYYILGANLFDLVRFK